MKEPEKCRYVDIIVDMPMDDIDESTFCYFCSIFSECELVLFVVCNVRAPYSGGSNFRQYFYGIKYLDHPLTSTENFTEIVSGEPIHRGS